ncbi:MAG: 4Fe-4S dicluster domain-containing protein [Candidatus Wallbacteria bacterium]|nr:4Fe-4S dicluster domain-containing protein [Candidatus Wallbacteria bacterium]
MIPGQYPPPVKPEEFVMPPAASADGCIDVGVLFVGAGPASLAGAIRLSQLLDSAPDVKASLGDMPVVIVDKGKYPGAHLLSGAVLNPGAFRKLFPDMKMEEFPFFGPVPGETVYFLTRNRAIALPVIPPTMQNHGNYIASLSKAGKWLGEKAEEQGVTILPETAAQKLVVEGGAVKGVRTGDKGLDRDGKPMSNFEEGPEIHARFTVLGEGPQGHLTGAALAHFGVKRSSPQIYSLGVKEVWEVKKPLDRVIHTMGWPLRAGAGYNEFGGSFCYPLGPDKVSIGLVAGLDYRDASLSVHDLFQQMKRHALFAEVLEGGKRAERGWGAKTIPEGGYWSLPEKLHVPGAAIVGDSAGFVNVPTLKGIHYAMWSGIYAAEAIFDSLRAKADPSADSSLAGYDQAVRSSFIERELYEVRNMRQAFRYGLYVGGAIAGMMTLTKGAFPGGKWEIHSDASFPMFDTGLEWPKADGKLTFDKLDSAFASGNRSRDNQPNHIRVNAAAPELLGKTWMRMCPAGVYEWHEKDGKKELFVNGTNCIHCGAITAKGGRLTPPEGGSGPEYTLM